jgi:hypothetical protein
MDASAIIKEPLTPSGYPPGPLVDSAGTRYFVMANGQLRRLERKLTKAEIKREKKRRRR